MENQNEGKHASNHRKNEMNMIQNKKEMHVVTKEIKKWLHQINYNNQDKTKQN